MKKRTNFIATASVNSLSLPSHADGQSLHLRVRYCHLMAGVQGAASNLQPEQLWRETAATCWCWLGGWSEAHLGILQSGITPTLLEPTHLITIFGSECHYTHCDCSLLLTSGGTSHWPWTSCAPCWLWTAGRPVSYRILGSEEITNSYLGHHTFQLNSGNVGLFTGCLFVYHLGFCMQGPITIRSLGVIWQIDTILLKMYGRNHLFLSNFIGRVKIKVTFEPKTKKMKKRWISVIFSRFFWKIEKI